MCSLGLEHEDDPDNVCHHPETLPTNPRWHGEPAAACPVGIYDTMPRRLTARPRWVRRRVLQIAHERPRHPSHRRSYIHRHAGGEDTPASLESGTTTKSRGGNQFVSLSSLPFKTIQSRLYMDRRNSTQKRTLHLSPALGSRLRRPHGRVAERRRLLARSTERDPASETRHAAPADSGLDRRLGAAENAMHKARVDGI